MKRRLSTINDMGGLCMWMNDDGRRMGEQFSDANECEAVEEWLRQKVSVEKLASRLQEM